MNENANFKRVLDTLANPDWDFRTTEGIAKDTEIDVNEVRKILEDNIPNFVRKSLLPDQYGRDIYAPAGRKIKFREHLAVVHYLIAPEQYTSQRA